MLYVSMCVDSLDAFLELIIVKEINIFKVPEVPKKVVPEEKVPTLKKKEPPVPKGICCL